MLRLTRTGKIFLAVIVAMHLASITSQSGLLIWLVGLLGGCIAVNAYAAIRSVRDVRLRVPNRMLIEEGASPREPWQLVNTGKRRARLITVESGNRVWLQTAEVPPGEAVSTLPRDVFKDRGAYSFENAWVVSLYPFGLAKAMRPANSVSEILVFPKLYAIPAPEVRGLDPMIGGRHTGPGRIPVGETFAGVRPVQPGDSFKQIHWKSSAKGVGLMVKTFEEELAGRAALLVYCDPSSQHSEPCIRAAGSLAFAGIEAGHQIEFHNLNESRVVRIPPFGDTTRLLEELARFNPHNVDASSWPDSLPPRSSLHIITTNATSELEQRVAQLLTENKMVVLHLPQGKSANVSCPIRHFRTG